MGEGASSEPRTTDLTAIEEAIWRGVTDDEPIPDHWPQWLIEVALDVVRVVEQQPDDDVFFACELVRQQTVAAVAELLRKEATKPGVVRATAQREARILADFIESHPRFKDGTGR